METGLIYLNEFTKAMFEAFPTFRVEVSFSKPSTRADKPWVHMMDLTVRLYEEEVQRVFGCKKCVLIYELEQLNEPKIYWEHAASEMKLELLNELEKDDGKEQDPNPT